MGLATVYATCKRHRGWIDVNTSLGTGSEFRLCLPIVEGNTCADRFGKAPNKSLPVTIQTPSIFSGTRGVALGTIRARSTVFHFAESVGGARDCNCRTRADSSVTVNGDSDHLASPKRSVDPDSSALTMSHSLALPCHARAREAWPREPVALPGPWDALVVV